MFYYDALNRLQQVNDPTNSYALVSQVHDGLMRRITEGLSGVDLYYSAGWQVVEERVYNTVSKSYVWSPVYVDAMIARDRDTDANGSLDERLYVTHDANFNRRNTRTAYLALEQGVKMRWPWVIDPALLLAIRRQQLADHAVQHGYILRQIRLGGGGSVRHDYPYSPSCINVSSTCRYGEL